MSFRRFPRFIFTVMVIASMSLPAFAAGKDREEPYGPISRIIRAIKQIIHSLDDGNQMTPPIPH